MNKSIKVLHLDSSTLWGGGQAQIHSLICESKHLPIEHHLASPKNSPLYLKTRDHISGYVPAGRNLLAAIVSLFRLRKYCLKNDIEILHAHCGKSHSFAYWLKIIFLPRLKLVVHRRIPAPIRQNVFSKRKFIDQNVNYFICVSNYIKNVLLREGVVESKVVTIRSSKKIFELTSSEKQDARPTLATTKDLAPEGNFFVFSASRLVPDKGLFILIESFRNLAKSHPEARLVIAGEGPLESQLKHTAKNLINTGHVVFLGFRNDIDKLLLGADVFAIPSLSEGLGSTIIEAMLAHTAVIGSSVEGIPELIQHGKTGLLVPPGDSSALQTALLQLADNPDERMKLAKEACKWATDNCGTEIMVERTFAVYKSLI
jgi:L-malate glycosyltransferase